MSQTTSISLMRRTNSMKIYVILVTEYYDGGLYPEDSQTFTSAEGHAFYSEEDAKAYCERVNAEYEESASEFDDECTTYKAHYEEVELN